ncbi:hypothetical protein OAE79_00095 [Rhodopirellula sp.]|nr:hypothetical protein [Rhodopirellula sp.]MDB4678712.1 hypothetical protein [Rhodopirellula sp.]
MSINPQTFFSKFRLDLRVCGSSRLLVIALSLAICAQACAAKKTRKDREPKTRQRIGSAEQNKTEGQNAEVTHEKSTTAKPIGFWKKMIANGQSMRPNGWTFGARPYGYDALGYPDPYFLFPYSLDPWVRGSFRAPDLLDDPYFYDRVPTGVNRVNRRGTGILRQHDPANRGDKSSNAAPKIESPEKSEKKPPLKLSNGSASQLRALEKASAKFADNLTLYQGGESWIRHLKPNMLSLLASQGQNRELNDLLIRYDQVVVQSPLKLVSTIEGFADCRTSLRGYLQSL